jgi:hypothetical protein
VGLGKDPEAVDVARRLRSAATGLFARRSKAWHGVGVAAELAAGGGFAAVGRLTGTTRVRRAG